MHFETQWGRIRQSRSKRLSWHLFATFTRVPGKARSVCNRTLDAETVRDTRPGNEKTCETCLRSFVGDTGVAPI